MNGSNVILDHDWLIATFCSSAAFSN